MPARFRRGPRAAGLILLAALAALAPGRGLPGAAAPDTVRAPAAAVAPRAAAAPVIPILDRYRLLAVYEVLPARGRGGEYSGLAVRSRTGRSVRLWLVDDKPLEMKKALAELRFELPGAPALEIRRVRPGRLRVANPERLPTGNDIEDIGWLDGGGDRPGVAVVVGERGPEDAPRSWFYLLEESGRRLRLRISADASAEGESLANDGLEGVAVRRHPTLPAGIEVFAFKERPAPTWVRVTALTWNGSAFVGAGGPDWFRIPEMSMQSGAVFDSAAGAIEVIDRRQRRIAAVPVGDRPGLIADAEGRASPREWLDYTAVDSLLEGRLEDTPPTLFGSVEGIALDRGGCLYLLSDNNEARHSRLLVLEPRPDAPPSGQ